MYKFKIAFTRRQQFELRLKTAREDTETSSPFPHKSELVSGTGSPERGATDQTDWNRPKTDSAHILIERSCDACFRFWLPEQNVVQRQQVKLQLRSRNLGHCSLSFLTSGSPDHHGSTQCGCYFHIWYLWTRCVWLPVLRQRLCVCAWSGGAVWGEVRSNSDTGVLWSGKIDVDLQLRYFFQSDITEVKKTAHCNKI